MEDARNKRFHCVEERKGKEKEGTEMKECKH